MVTYRFKSMQIYGKYRFKLYRFKLPFYRIKFCIYDYLNYHKCNLLSKCYQGDSSILRIAVADINQWI